MVDERRARRERQRRQIRRQRLLAAAALVVAAGAIAAALLAGGGSDGTRSAGATAAGAGRAGPGSPAQAKVRNATPQPDWEPHTGPVPILEYHVLGAAPADEPYPDLYIRRPIFHRQMDWLAEHG